MYQNVPLLNVQQKNKRTVRANDSRKILSVKATTVAFVMLYFKAISGKPGAIIELHNGGINV